MIEAYKDDSIKRQIRDYASRTLTKTNGGNYVCPFPTCGSGSHKRKTGGFHVYEDNFYCFGCKEHGDIFDLIGVVENITDKAEQAKRAVELYGAGAVSAEVQRYQNYPKTERKEAPQTDYTSFFMDAHAQIGATSYHRGLSKATLDRFNIGYVEAWRHPKAPATAPTTPRLIIPTSKYSYLARDTRANVPDSQQGYTKQKVGKVHLLNIEALNTATQPIYLVEGELDALSIIDVGGEAVGLGSVAYTNIFLKYATEHRPAKPLILALDNDKAGADAERKLAEELTKLNIEYISFNPCGEYKDANEALVKAQASFKEAVADGVRKAESMDEEKQREQADELENYKHEVGAGWHLVAFYDGIQNSVDTPYRPTGFKELDRTLDGGLYEGLYIVGAISSLGKTTFCLQMADQLAQQGQDVLIFSLEMARSELIAKSISRMTSVLNTLDNKPRQPKDYKHLEKTTRQITTKKFYEKYTQEDKDMIERAFAEYSTFADNIYVKEAEGRITVDAIKEAVAKHKRLTGKAPVVVVDYLQLLIPTDPRTPEKQNVDINVMTLKQLSRDYKTPVIAVSSLNRVSYNEAVSMASFKESGGIEYSADVLIGLQLKGAGTKDFDVDKAKDANPREIELKILKNRNGRTGVTLNFKYYSWYNKFTEA